VTIMSIGMALTSRILTGEEPCLRKVQYSRMYELPVDAELIKHRMNHELLISKVINGLTGEIYVNYQVERDLGEIQLIGLIDILNINRKSKTIFEIKSGKERESHHVQLWLYMGCFDDVKGILRYPSTRYMYFTENIPENLWEMVTERLNPLQTKKLLPPLKNGHCVYCKYRNICKKRGIVENILLF